MHHTDRLDLRTGIAIRGEDDGPVQLREASRRNRNKPEDVELAEDFC